MELGSKMPERTIEDEVDEIMDMAAPNVTGEIRDQLRSMVQEYRRFRAL